MNRISTSIAVGVSLAAISITARQIGAIGPAPATGEQSLAQAAVEQKHTFLVFHKDSGPLTQQMIQAVRQGLASRSDRATATTVNVTSPAEAALVKRLGVDRAPMPLTIVLAPNGAVTGAYPLRIAEEQISGSFATPALASCLKSLQDGKLVFVCFHHAVVAEVPQGVEGFRANPEFKDRTHVLTVQIADPEEADFLRQMKINTAVTSDTTTAFFAPPGMLVGTYNASATMSDLAGALHKAGKCCDDPNCKHNHGEKQQTPATGTQRQAAQNSNTTRN